MYCIWYGTNIRFVNRIDISVWQKFVSWELNVNFLHFEENAPVKAILLLLLLLLLLHSISNT